MRESDTATSRAESAQETCSTACQRDLTSRRRIANLIVCMCVPAWMSCFCRYAWHTILHNQHTSSGDPAGALSPIARHDRACDSTNAGGTAAAERASMPLSSSVRDKPRFESSRHGVVWCGTTRCVACRMRAISRVRAMPRPLQPLPSDPGTANCTIIDHFLDLNRDWSPRFSRCVIKTAGFEPKRPEI